MDPFARIWFALIVLVLLAGGIAYDVIVYRHFICLDGVFAGFIVAGLLAIALGRPGALGARVERVAYLVRAVLMLCTGALLGVAFAVGYFFAR